MENLMGLIEGAASVVSASASTEAGSSEARATFQWGGTISALFLLLLNRTGQRSARQTDLLVLYLFTSFPTVLFKIIRGDFGHWVAFLAVAAKLFFPETFSASRFIIFVITPSWLANGLRDSIAGGVFCLIIGIILVLIEIRRIGGLRSCECNLHCSCYWLAMSFLFFFTILYLCRGTW